MLCDGSISLSKVNKGEGKYAITIKINSLNYLQYLNEDIYSQFTNTNFFILIRIIHFLNIKENK